jgi:hypothetical protein
VPSAIAAKARPCAGLFAALCPHRGAQKEKSGPKPALSVDLTGSD